MYNATQIAAIEAATAKVKAQFPAATENQLCDAQMNADDSGFEIGSSDWLTVFMFSIESIINNQ